jgi:hypothetical protein
MLISLSVHLLLLMFELLVADNLGANRHLWILVNQSINQNILYFTISPGLCHEMRVADPHSIHPDPDPAPPIYAEYRSGSNPDPGL